MVQKRVKMDQNERKIKRAETSLTGLKNSKKEK